MANGLSNSVIEMQENRNEILKTEIEVEVKNVSTDGTDFVISLQNTGSTKIGDFTYMDIIVNYQNESDTMKTVWIPYQKEGGLSENNWTDLDIVPDLINPGVFDPGEEMELQVWLDTSDGNSSVNWVLVTAPNGVKASRYFN